MRYLLHLGENVRSRFAMSFGEGYCIAIEADTQKEAIKLSSECLLDAESTDGGKVQAELLLMVPVGEVEIAKTVKRRRKTPGVTNHAAS